MAEDTRNDSGEMPISMVVFTKADAARGKRIYRENDDRNFCKILWNFLNSVGPAGSLTSLTHTVV